MIERQPKRDIFNYCLADKRYFEDIQNYKADLEQSFHRSLRKLLGPKWNIRPIGVWYRCTPERPDKIPAQGFKIHVSATSLTSDEILRRVCPVLESAKAVFKVVADTRMLDVINSKNFNRSSSGKFITIYPSSIDEFIRLAEAINDATIGMDGPYILTDKRFKKSKVVHYRYGGFKKRFLLNIHGEHVPGLQMPSGEMVADKRLPMFHLPSWVIDPFAEPQKQKMPSKLLLGGRFSIEKALRFSNAGGIYIGTDSLTGAKVLIKEARPFVNIAKGDTQDAVASLKREFSMLQRLECTGYTPAPLACLHEWEHCFLIEEFIDGVSFGTYRATDGVGLLTHRHPSSKTISLFLYRFFTIGRNLLQALKSCHAAGIIIGDLAPGNIMVNPDTLDIHIIDLEGAVELDVPPAAGFRLPTTNGYTSPRRRNGGLPSTEDDCHALGCILRSFIHPVREFSELSPAADSLFMDEINRDFSLPSIVQDSIESLLNGNMAESIQIFDVGCSTPRFNITYRPPHQLHVDSDELTNVCSSIAKGIEATADCSRTDRLWPSDCRVFLTNPLSLAFGALGPAMYLKRIRGCLPERIEGWLLDKKLSTTTYPPGMFMGLGGIACGFLNLGWIREAKQAMDIAYQSPLLYASPDFFLGAAGWGWASLSLYAETNERNYLDRACLAAEFLQKTAIRLNGHCSWKAHDNCLYYGMAHGASGIALFLLHLYSLTDHQAFLDDAVAAMEFEISNSIKSDNHIIWPRSAGSNLNMPYWRFGTAGIGSVLIRFADRLNDSRYLQIAELAAHSSVTKFSVYPGQFCGMAGIGEFMLDMFQFVGKQEYLDYAHQMTNLLNFAVEDGTGLAFPGEQLIRLSYDYGTGASGVGFFLDRLQHQRKRLFMLD